MALNDDYNKQEQGANTAPSSDTPRYEYDSPNNLLTNSNNQNQQTGYTPSPQTGPAPRYEFDSPNNLLTRQQYQTPSAPAPQEGPVQISYNKPDNPYPVEDYNAVNAEGTPQNVSDSMKQFSQVNIASQEYADQMQSKIIEDYYKYQDDPNYQGMLNRTYTNQTYDYLKRKNNNASDVAWSQPKPEDDLWTNWLPEWTKAQELERETRAKEEQQVKTVDQKIEESVLKNATATQQDIMNSVNQEHGNWNLMNWWDRAWYILTPGSSPYTVDEAPGWATKLAKSVMPTMMSAGMGSMVGGIAGGILGSIVPGAGTLIGSAAGAKIGAAVFGGATFLQGMTGIEIPVIADIQEKFNYLGDKTEQALGTLSTAREEAKRLLGENYTTIELCKATADVLQDPKYDIVWKLGKLGYEAGAGTYIDEITNGIYNAGVRVMNNLFGKDYQERNISDVNLNNIGLSWVERPEETHGGTVVVDQFLPIYQGLHDAAIQYGKTEKEAEEFALQNMENYVYYYYGATGMTNDFIAQSYQDPTNFIQFAGAKLAQGIGHVTGDVSLEAAGRAAAGNPFIDALDPVSQPVIESILTAIYPNRKTDVPDIFKPYGSQGLDTITNTWRNNLRVQPDANKLSAIQKNIAGIDKNGKIAEYGAFKPTNTGIKAIDNVVNGLKRAFSLTDEAKMYDMAEMTTEYIGSLLFEGDTKMYQLPDLIAQITGKADIPDKGGVLSSQKNSALMNTLRDALNTAPDNIIQQISDDVLKYRSYGQSREVLASVADQLKMTPKEILDALDNRRNGADIPEVQKKKGRKGNNQQNDSVRQELFQKMRNMDVTFTDANGKVMDTEAVIKSIDRFKGHRQLYSETFFKADIMEKLGKTVDDYNLKRYNIQPDAWQYRLTNLMKDVQSIALLNFSPSYMVNNFLNNLITRTVAGVGGVDTDFVKTVNAERGLFFSRDNDVTSVYGNTGKRIQKSKKANDTLTKFSDMFKEVKDNKILKGVSNIKIEDLETRAASDLGMRRYWDATWEHNMPDFPDSWDALGIDDATKARIRDIAYDSPNVKVFYDKIMGEVVVPEAQSVIKHMLDNNYDGKAKTVIEDTISKSPWISSILNEALLANDVNEVNKVMNHLRDTYTTDINMKNVQQMESTFDDYRVRFSGEGLGAVGTAIDVLNDMFTDVWVRQSKQNLSLFMDRIVKKMSGDEFDPQFKRLINIQNGDYNIVRGYAVKMVAAMCEGLGLKDDVSLKVLENTMKRFDIAAEQVQENHKVYQKYATKRSDDYNFKYYRQSRLDMLKKTQDILLQADIELDNILVQHLRDTLDPSMEGRIDLFAERKAEIIAEKQKLNEKLLKDEEKRLDAYSKKKRADFAIEQERTTNRAKQHIANLQDEVGLIFQSLDNSTKNNPVQAQPMTLDATLRIAMLIDEAKIGTDRAGEFLTHYVDKSDPAKVFDPIEYRNKHINTSFREYAQAKMKPAELAANQALYDSGAAVRLGSANTKQSYTSVSDTYELIDPNANVKSGRWVQAKCKPVQTSDGIAEAGVYHNGKHIGYIIEGMPEKVAVGGNEFPVIGMSKDTPNTYLVLVQDKVWEVTPGNPKGADFSVYAQENFHPVAVGATPTVQPWGTAALESSLAMREAFDLLETQAITELQNARTNGSILGKLTPEQREAVLAFVDSDLRPAYAVQRYQTQKYGDMMVDASLLNYNRRYGFDNTLTAIMPYQFWMTRSVMNWGKRMITQPKWFASYARMERLIEKNKRDILPSRLEGTIGIPMPNLGDGLGSTLYIDPLGIIFPFKQFNDAPQYYIGNLHTVHNNTLTVIDEYFNEGKPYNGYTITQEDYDLAMEGKGNLYKQVFSDMQKMDETDTTGLGLLGTFLSPNVLVDALWKKMSGREGSISSSPMFRLGNTIKAAGDSTGLQWLTDAIGGAMQVPDKAFRKALNIQQNPEGAFFDYYMTNFITDMGITYEISYDDMTRALAEGPGNPIYDEALKRFHQQQAIRQQGGALAVELGQSLGGNKKTSAGDLLGSLAASMFGAKVMSKGEEKYREIKVLRDKVKSTKDEDLMKKFQNEFPEYSIHNWSYEDDPEERIHKMMVAKVWATYYALPEAQQNRAKVALGDKFSKLFIDKENRAYDYFSTEELGDYIRAMEGDDPTFSPDDINNPMRESINVAWYADQPVAQYEYAKEVFDQRFPGFYEIQNGYYALETDAEREAYKQKFPELEKGWEWIRTFKEANPAAGVIWDEKSPVYKVGQGEYDSIIEARIGELSESYLKRFRDYATSGFALPKWTLHTARSLYASANTDLSFEDWMKQTFANR